MRGKGICIYILEPISAPDQSIRYPNSTASTYQVQGRNADAARIQEEVGEAAADPDEFDETNLDS